MTEKIFPMKSINVFLTQLRIVEALMIRHAMSRFGRKGLGIFWIFAEPMLLCAAVMLMWSILGLQKGHGIGIVPFALSSYSLVTLWRHICADSIRPLHRSVNLLYHRNIQPFDVILATTVLETLAGFTAFLIAYTLLFIFGLVAELSDPLLLIAAWCLMAWFGMAFGLLIAGLTELSDTASHFVQPFLYVTLPATGTFYMVLWLPQSLQETALWSPLVQIFELFRAGMFGESFAADWDVWYVVKWCIVMSAMGLSALEFAKKRFSVV